MKQVRDFLKERGLIFHFLRKQIMLLKISDFFGAGSHIRSLEARWAITRLTYRTESSSTTRRKTLGINIINNTLDYISTWQDWFRKHRNIERCLKNLELLKQPLDQKLIDFDEEKKNFHEKYDAKVTTEKNSRPNIKALDKPGVPWIHDINWPAISSRITPRKCANESINCAIRSHPRFCHSRLEVWDESPRGKSWMPKGRDYKSSNRFRIITRHSEQLGWSRPQFDSMCLCWWKCWYIDVIRQQNYRTSNHSLTTSWRWPMSCFDLVSIHCRKQHQYKLAAAPSTPPASIPKVPMTVPNSSIPTTSLSIGGTAPAVRVPDYGGPKQGDAEAIFVDKWAQPTVVSSWEISFKSEVSHFSQYPRAAMLRIGEVEDAESMDGLIASASWSGRPIPDFENLDFKIASGLRKILTGNFKKQVTTAEGKAQSEKRSLTGKQIPWLIYDSLLNQWRQWIHLGHWRFHWKLIWRTTTFRSSTQSGRKYYQQSLTDLPTTYWRVCTGCNLKSRKNWKTCSTCTRKRRHLATRNTIIADWSWWPKDILSTKSKILASKRETETCTDRAKEKRAEKAKKMPTAPREKTASVGSRKANVQVESRAFKHVPNKQGRGKGWLSPPSPTGSPHRNSKGDGKGYHLRQNNYSFDALQTNCFGINIKL